MPGLLVIAHRGASGHRPEHTLEAYALGARLGADFIEPDLVACADGTLVARHENEISGTTDVAEHPEFADRRTTRTIDGREVSGWFTEDFTLQELRRLRARERIPDLRPGNAAHDGAHRIPTFEEVLELAASLERELDRPVGVYPETKHPGYFRSIGLPLEPPLIRSLRRHDLDRPDAPVFVQSFEEENLRDLREELKVPLVLLIAAAARPPFDFDAIAGFATAVGPAKQHLLPRDAEGRSLPATSFVDEAHAAGLAVHPYTFRSENAFLPLELRSSADRADHGNHAAEYRAFLRMGVDAVFSDFPDHAVAARDAWAGEPAG